MNRPDQRFAVAFDQVFTSKTQGSLPLEIPLFKALRGSILDLGSQFDIEEYHGSSKQVRFLGNGTYARNSARCELSDLAIVVFSSITNSIRYNISTS